MKKKYCKPELGAEPLGFRDSIVTNCVDADEYWMPINMGDGYIIFVEEVGCNISDHDYMAQNGGDDGACLYASTSDGKTFNS